jgi:two-component system NarL family sensor kinase
MNCWYLKIFYALILLPACVMRVHAQPIVPTKITNADTALVINWSDSCWLYLQKKIELAQQYANEEIILAEKINIPKFIAIANNDIGLVRLNQGNYEQSLKYNLVALQIRTQLKDEPGMASSLNKIGTIYTKQNKHAAALEVTLQCLHLFEKLGVKKNVSQTLNNLAHIYKNIGNEAKCLEYYQKALALNRSLNFDVGTVTNLLNIGNYYNRHGMPDSALVYLIESKHINAKSLNHYIQAAILMGIGVSYELQKKWNQALSTNLQALNEAMFIKDTTNVIAIYHNRANLFLSLDQLSNAFNCLVITDSLIQKSKQFFNNKEQYKLWFKYYNQIHQPSLAEQYFRKYDSLKDAILNEKLTAQVTEMDTKYESKKKEEENKLLKKDNQIKTLSLWFLIIGLLLLSISFYLIYNRYTIKQKAKLENAILEEQILKSKAVIDAEEAERQRIAKDLHDGIGQMLSAVKLNLSSIQLDFEKTTTKNTQIANAISLIDDSVKEVRTISHNMMPNLLLKKGLANAVREFIDKIDGTGLKIELEISGLQNRLNQDLEIVLYRVIQELINNIIKHAKASQVSIQILKYDDEISIMIQDNGAGFNFSAVLQKEAGIGLKNIITRIEYFKGQINFDSTINKGTTVIIEIPLT